MKYDRKQVISRGKRSAFHSGIKPWLRLSTVVFLFSFLKIADTGAAAFLHAADRLLHITANTQGTSELLQQYALHDDPLHPIFNNRIFAELLNALTEHFSGTFRFLSANIAYFRRNTGEVAGLLMLAGILSVLYHTIVVNMFYAGRLRFYEEQHLFPETKFRRMLSPYHRKYLLREFRVMFCYHLTLFLWIFTVIGYFYKSLQYMCVPYILAENPGVSWRQARSLSMEMTRNHIFDLFKTRLSLWYTYLLKYLPFIGFMYAVPCLRSVDTEIYFTLRANVLSPETECLLPERSFDRLPCSENTDTSEPIYLLTDVITDIHQETDTSYNPADYILFFFFFSFAGWIWEVMLHLVQQGKFVNRGTMYGPWLPIYGIGGVLCIFLLNRFRHNIVKTVLLIVVIAAVLEYASSWFLDYFDNASYWSYKGMLLNLNGRICLVGLTAFAIGGSAAIYLFAPMLKRHFLRMGRKKQNALCVLLIIIFIIDVCCVHRFGMNTGSGVGGVF